MSPPKASRRFTVEPHLGAGSVPPGGVANARPRCGSLLYVVRHVGPEHRLEMPPPVDQDVVQALRADRPNEALRERVRLGSADGRSDHPDALGVEDSIEGARGTSSLGPGAGTASHRAGRRSRGWGPAG